MENKIIIKKISQFLSEKSTHQRHLQLTQARSPLTEILRLMGLAFFFIPC
jgi:hypothetical protein